MLSSHGLRIFMKTSIFPFFFLFDVTTLLEKSFSLFERFGGDLSSM